MSGYKACCACGGTLEVPTAFASLIDKWIAAHSGCLGAPPGFYTNTEQRLTNLARDVEELRRMAADVNQAVLDHDHVENLISRTAELETLLGLNDDNEQPCDKCHGEGFLLNVGTPAYQQRVVCPQCRGRRTIYVPPWDRAAHRNDIIDREFDEEEARHTP